jgi:hypothetical protein
MARLLGTLITANSGTFTLIGADGYTTLFTIDTNVSDITLISDPNSVRIGVNDVLGVTGNVGARLALAINTIYTDAGVSGITATGTSTLTLTQVTHGAHGNTDIGLTASNMSRINFYGGKTIAQPPFSKRFQLVRAPEDTGEALRRNDQKTEA